MSRLPRILIIDDQYGRSQNPGTGQHPRSSFCLLGGLSDITNDISPETVEHPIAEVIFCQGQVYENGLVQNDLAGTLEVIRNGWKEWPRWAMIMLDLKFITGKILPDGTIDGCEEDSNPQKYFGLEILEQINLDPELQDIPVVLLSAMDRDPIEKRFADNLACDFLDKDEVNRRQGRKRIETLLEKHGLIEDQSGKIIGHSVSLLKCLREARRRAKLENSNILLFGETGTGKELLADYIYRCSGREPFVPCLLNSVPDTLVEDLIFGHKRGAFQGANENQAGKAELADEGVLFIDEFGDITPKTQPKLLRLLHTDIRETQRLGSNESKKLDLLVVAATERFEIINGEDSFRKSLLQRVNISNPVEIPPLRDRKEDIPDLVEYFVRHYEQEFKDLGLGAERREISSEAIEYAVSYSWPGNVNELRTVVERAVFENSSIRYLSKKHIKLPIPEPVETSFESTPGDHVTEKTNKLEFSELLAQLESFKFATAPEKRDELAGTLPRLKGAYLRCFSNLLKAALIATSKPTHGDPIGKIEITPALNLLEEQKYRKTKVNQIISRQIKNSPEAVREYWRSDDVLKKLIPILSKPVQDQLKPKKELFEQLPD